MCRCDPRVFEAALRIWSAKEAVSKATGIPLAESWHRVEVTAVEPMESRLCIDMAEGFTAIHATAGAHLFTLFNLPCPLASQP